MMEPKDRYLSFWIRDLHHNLVEHTCDPSTLNNVCVNDKPEAPFDVTPVFFKRDVLSKYYNAPHKYSVRDGLINFIEEGIIAKKKNTIFQKEKYIFSAKI